VNSNSEQSNTTLDSDAVFTSLLPTLQARMLALSRCPQIADDIVQDCYLQWVRQCDQRGPPHYPRAWLLTVAARRYFVLARRPLSSNVGEAADQVASVVADPAQSYERAILKDDVTAALATLSEMQRDVVIGKLMNDLTFREIAEQLDIAVPTAKTHYLRALRHLRERLQEVSEIER